MFALPSPSELHHDYLSSLRYYTSNLDVADGGRRGDATGVAYRNNNMERR